MKKTKRILAVILVAVMALALTGCDSGDYKNALKTMESGDYAAAAAAFKALGDYKDSAAQAQECDYQLACEKLDEGAYDEAKAIFEGIAAYEDSAELINECDYLTASDLLESGDFEGACELFEALGDYKDSAELLIDAEKALLEQRVIGNWLSEEVDLTEFVLLGLELEMGEEAENFLQYCPIEGFAIRLKMELTDSGNIYAGCEEESFEESANKVEESIRSGFGDYLMAAVDEALAEEGATLADLEAILGEEVTPEYLAREMYGVSFDELVDSFFDVSAMIDPASFVVSGTWEVEDGKIKIVDSQETEYAEYDPETDTLTMTGEGLEESEVTEMLYPVVFNRA